jgi:hypothetical protein
MCRRSGETTSRMILWMETLIPIPAGVIANVIGVLILHQHGIHEFHGQLPSLAQAASVGAIGQVLLF